MVTEAGELKLPYTVRVEAHQEQEKESYAYFVSADPIEPLPAEQKETEKEPGEAAKEAVRTVVAVTGETEEELAPEEARRIAQQILSMPRLSEPGFAGLERLYHRCGSKEMLSDICSQLIKDGRTDGKSFFWYKRGVQAELKITKLYEYFMRSVRSIMRSPFRKTCYSISRWKIRWTAGEKPSFTRTLSGSGSRIRMCIRRTGSRSRLICWRN